jgi:acyl-CoA thioester hydrolase
MPKPPNETTIRIRYAETDQMGVAHHGTYLTWFEAGRTELLRATGLSYREVELDGLRLPVIEASVKYIRPIRYDDLITIVTHLDGTASVRMRFKYDIFCGEELCATGSTCHVFTDADLKPKRPSGRLRKLLSSLPTSFKKDTTK